MLRVNILYTKTSRLNVKKSSFIKNKCSESFATGIAIYSIINQDTLIEDSIFKDNECNGNTIQSIRTPAFKIKDSIIERTISRESAVDLVDGGTLENVIIRDNNCQGLSVTQKGIFLKRVQIYGNQGSGIEINCKEISISDTIIFNNTAFHGAGVVIKSMDVSTMKNVSIFNNIATFGGGIYLEKVPNYRKLEKIKVFNNFADIGGGIYAESGNILDFFKIEISNNFANRGAGLYMNEASIDFEETLIKENHALEYGGGIYCNRGRKFGNVLILNNTIDNIKCDQCRGC